MELLLLASGASKKRLQNEESRSGTLSWALKDLLFRDCSLRVTTICEKGFCRSSLKVRDVHELKIAFDKAITQPE